MVIEERCVGESLSKVFDDRPSNGFKPLLPMNQVGWKH